MIDKKHITGIILAGGKSSRMGTDKGFLKLNGKTFVQHSIDALTPLVSKIIIVSDHEKYDSLGYQRITDTVKNAGPISGILSGLEASKTNYNFILSCDIPLITTAVLKQLLSAYSPDKTIIQAESNGKSMPLIAFYKTQVKQVFKHYLEQNERRLRVVVKACQFKTVPLNDNQKRATLNINTKEELKHIKDAYQN
jgi:molybdopterin-guanine dinucleotide biosynthesis protein A